jgi:GNAT superfamily N-acetyltransferase
MVEIARCSNENEKLLSVEAYNTVWPHESVTLDEVHSFEASLLDHCDLLARVDGEPAGSGFAALSPERPEIVIALVTVIPAHRRRGVGSRFYEAISGWSRERGIETIEAVVSDDDPESLEFAQRRGFVEERREKGVALELGSIEPPPVEPPRGIEIVTWAKRPELARGIYEVVVEAYPDVPGWEDAYVEPFEDWLAHDMRGPGDFPEATFVAVAGDEVVGYAKFSITAARPDVASHDLTGVKRAWRGRGVARALKAAQIGWAKESGYRELRTRNDERNAPIRRLNAEFGYRPAVGRIYLKGPLAAAPDP